MLALSRRYGWTGWTKQITAGDTEMGRAWRRILVISGVIALGVLGALEVVMSRLQVDQAPIGTAKPGEDPMPWQDFLNAQGRLPSLEVDPAADRETGEGPRSAGEQVAEARRR